ncbi:MAG: hypothetical protein WKF40_09910 [Thermoleophilaceae bacterium]
MDVIHEIEPDVREVLRVGESFFLELPEPDLREQVDAETATLHRRARPPAGPGRAAAGARRPAAPHGGEGGRGVPPRRPGGQALGRGAAAAAARADRTAATGWSRWRRARTRC